MPLQRVDFICPRCQMFCKPEHPKIEVERTEDRVAYGHERCYRVNDEGDQYYYCAPENPITVGGTMCLNPNHEHNTLGDYSDV